MLPLISGSQNNRFGSFLREPAETYHAKAKDNLSSHQLAEFRRCPLFYRRRRLGLIPDLEFPALVLGRAAHTLILEGRDEYKRRFAIGGPVDPATGVMTCDRRTKLYKAWARTHNKPVLTHDQAIVNEEMYASVHGHPVAGRLLADGVAEAVVRCEYRGLPCQARIDWFNPNAGLCDLKTCADLDRFEQDVQAFGYVSQLAFYRTLVQQVTGVPVPAHLIAVEKQQPYRCGVWKIHPHLLYDESVEIDRAIARLKLCQENDHWPTGYEEMRTFGNLKYSA